MDVLHTREQIGKFGQFMVVRGEEGSRASVRLQIFDHGPGDREAVEGGRAAADFVEQHQAMRRGQIQYGGDLAHFDEKSGAAAGQIIGGPDAREDAIGDRQPRLLGGHKRAHLRQQDDQRRLAQVGGLAAHIRPCDQEDLVTGGVEVQRVGNKALALLFQKMFDDGMSAAEDEHLAAIGEFGPDVAPRGGQHGERGQHVQLRDGGRGAAQTRRLPGHPGAHLGEEPPFDFADTLVGGENFALVFLEFGRGEALGIYESLLALEIGRNKVQVGLGNFDIKTEDLVITNLQRADAGALALAFFHGRDHLPAALAEIAQAVEFRIESPANDPGIRCQCGRIFGNGSVEALLNVG